MITVQLTNGFGNNIFQYVAARLLAEHHGQELSVLPPSPDYYAIPDLEQIGIDFTHKSSPTDLLVTDQYYLQAYSSIYKNQNMRLRGYFEDYKYYYPHLDKIKTWFSPIIPRDDNALVLHIRTGDRLFMKNEFYTKPRVEKYLSAIGRFNFSDLYIVTDMPVWKKTTASELSQIRFHREAPTADRVPIAESVQYINSLIEGLDQFNPIINNGTVGQDFNFIRTFSNIMFEHGTLSWWAAFLSDADKVGVYGPWRPWKNKKKNLSQIPLDGWFKWE